MPHKPTVPEKIDKRRFRTFEPNDRAEIVADKINQILTYLSTQEEEYGIAGGKIYNKKTGEEIVEKPEEFSYQTKKKWSQCNDCFDGDHVQCIGLEKGCECECQRKNDMGATPSPQEKEWWIDEFLKTHYEPEHEKGQTCWCEPRTIVKGKYTHIEHNEQRVILVDLIKRIFTVERESERE